MDSISPPSDLLLATCKSLHVKLTPAGRCWRHKCFLEPHLYVQLMDSSELPWQATTAHLSSPSFFPHTTSCGQQTSSEKPEGKLCFYLTLTAPKLPLLQHTGVEKLSTASSLQWDTGKWLLPHGRETIEEGTKVSQNKNDTAPQHRSCNMSCHKLLPLGSWYFWR